MKVRRVDPADEDELVEWHGVLEAADQELWPDVQGYGVRDVTAFARFAGTTRRWELLAAADPFGPVTGVGMMEFPLRDNRHAVDVTVAVHPVHRRKGVGTAIVESMDILARADGRGTLNTIVDVPVAVEPTHPSQSFAPRLGFVATMSGNSRHLRLPVEGARLDELRGVVAAARGAGDYRTSTFEAPWPRQLAADQCALLRVMSTDEPLGDEAHEEEVWDEARIREDDELRAARGAHELVAVSEHVPSGRVVALSEIVLSDDAPHQAWQAVTVVHPAHRGRRLGLAVKIANLEFLARRAPGVRLVTTANAGVNAPMIAVNDMLGFEIAGQGTFWQKQLAP